MTSNSQRNSIEIVHFMGYLVESNGIPRLLPRREVRGRYGFGSNRNLYSCRPTPDLTLNDSCHSTEAVASRGFAQNTHFYGIYLTIVSCRNLARCTSHFNNLTKTFKLPFKYLNNVFIVLIIAFGQH